MSIFSTVQMTLTIQASRLILSVESVSIMLDSNEPNIPELVSL